MIGRLRKLRGRSLAELRERAAQAISARLEAQGFGETVGELSDDALLRRFSGPHLGGSGALGDRLHRHFSARSAPALLSGVRDRSIASALAGERWAKTREAVVREADRVSRGRFRMLGYDDLDFGTPIDWHRDPVTRLRAPIAHWSRIPYLDAAVAGDHKVIWELNRHQYFFTLGRAYQFTGRAVYAETFARHVTAWMDANPPKVGVNWASSLEIAYRSIAWMWALEFFREAEALTPTLLRRLLGFAYTHGRHLERYLSTYFSPNTHLTGEALGLLYLGTCLPEFACAARWRERGWRIVQAQATRQIHPDGVYFEQTTYYHRYTLDIYLHAMRLAESNGWKVPEVVNARVTALARCLADIVRPDGTIPIIGDDDGGQLVLLEERARADVRAALVCASVMLDAPEIGASARVVTEEVVWTLGAAALPRADAAVSGDIPSHTSRLFPDGGIAVMRDGWSDNAVHMVIDCGPLGTMNCGHAHADALALELWWGGAEVLIDPGTFAYTTSAEDRALFRHTAMHNTVTVDGAPSSVSAGPFSWATRADAHVHAWWHGALVDHIAASHDGFCRLDASAAHARRVYFVRGRYVVVVDTVVGTLPHEVVAHWHLAPGATVSELSPLQRNIELQHPKKGTVHVRLLASGTSSALTTHEAWVSPEYGARMKAPVLRVTSSGAATHRIISVLVPVRDPSTSVQAVLAEGGHAIRITDNTADDLVLIPSDAELRSGDVAFRGEFALLRRAASSGLPTDVALVGNPATLVWGELQFAASGTRETSRNDPRWRTANHRNAT